MLELSRRSASKPERLDLVSMIRDFREEFCATLQVGPELVQIVGPAAGAAPPATSLDIRVDPSQMQQVLWNLCQNALTHGRSSADTASPVEIRYGGSQPTGGPTWRSWTRGPAFPWRIRSAYSSRSSRRAPRGTGLGLFLARELAQANRATLLHESGPRGGTVFRLVFSDPARWEA